MNWRWILPLVAVLFVAGAKKQPPLTVRFHVEGNAQDTDVFATPVTLQNPPRQAFVQKIPAISERDIQSIFPFEAGDGSLGCAFKLDDHGRIALDTLSVEKRSTSLVAVLNGRQVVDMIIDKRVSDGIISIPRGLTSLEINMLQKKYPILGAAKKH